MRIEALKPLRVKVGDQRLELRPGEPVELQDADAKKLLLKAPHAVRVVSNRQSWLRAFEALVNATAGITKEDARYPAILEAWDDCDTAFAEDDWTGFTVAFERVIEAVKGKVNG